MSSLLAAQKKSPGDLRGESVESEGSSLTLEGRILIATPRISPISAAFSSRDNTEEIMALLVRNLCRQRRHFAHLDTNADDGRILLRREVRIGRRDDRAVGQQMEAGIKAVFERLQPAHSILPRLVLLDVINYRPRR